MTVYTITSAIDHTGATDVAVALEAWIANGANTQDGTLLAPNTVRFQANGLYRCEQTIDVISRNNLIFDMNGAELVRTEDNPWGVEAATAVGSDKFTPTGRFNMANHGMDGSAPIQISGGLKYTTGIVQRGSYWPVSISANSFALSNSQGGGALPIGTTATAADVVANHNNPVNDDKINFRNAPVGPVNPSGLRAFTYSTDFPGNFNYANAQIQFDLCTNIHFTSLSGRGTITGSQDQSNGFSGTYDVRYEGCVGILISACTGVEVDTIDVQFSLGDNIEILDTGTGKPDTIHVHDVTMICAGRHNFTIGNGGASNVLLEDASIKGGPRHLVDIESDSGGTMENITLRRTYFRSGQNTLGWIACGGTTVDISDLVIGGLLGHPLDGNVLVGCPSKFNAPTPGPPPPSGYANGDESGVYADFPGKPLGARRGPYTFGYNYMGGQIQLHTNGTTTATYSGLTPGNFTGFTDAQLLIGQSIKASNLPNPCQINAVSGSTITLSHPAKNISTATATFGSETGGAGQGALLFRYIDGANAFFNVGVIQPSANTVGALYNNCTGINDHNNTWFNGAASAITFPVTSGGTPVKGTAKVVGGGMMQVTGSVTSRPGTAVFHGGGIMRVTSSIHGVLGQSQFDGGGIMEATGVPYTPAHITGVAAFNGGGVMTATGNVEVDAIVSIDGGGVMSAAGDVAVSGDSLIDGGGVMSAVGSGFSSGFGSAFFDGGGVMTAIGDRGTSAISSLIDGGGVMTAMGTAGRSALSSLIVGGGVMQAVGLVGKQATVSIVGGGVMTAHGDRFVDGSTNILGGGVMVAHGTSHRRKPRHHVGEIVNRGPGFGVGPFGSTLFGGDLEE